MQITMKRLLLVIIGSLCGVFFLVAATGLFYLFPRSSRAASGSFVLKIATQGHHREGDRVTAAIDFYNGPGKTNSEPKTVLTYQGSSFTAAIELPSDFRYQDRYGLFVKPEKHVGRVFCNPELTGTSCTQPGFTFLNNGSVVDLSRHVFYAGDIPPMNGKVDAQDISLIMRDLGKIASGEAATDVNNDKITDIVDYSLALFSLAAQKKDDEVHLVSPQAPSPTFSLYPSETPVPSPTVVPTVKPTVQPTLSPTPVPPTPTATAIPTPTGTPAPTLTPTPTPLPRLGKNCTNGTTKVTKSINSGWNLDVLRIPYGRSQYQCVPVEAVVLHWSDSATFLGNQATWDTLNSRNIVCGLAIDDKETRQMSNFYDDKVTWEGCSSLENSINIEINGTEFDLWYDANCHIVNPATNPALAAGELQQAKQKIASQYGISTTVLKWEDQKYEDIMVAQEKRVLDAVRYLLAYYNISKDKVTGHFKLTTSKVDPGPRFLDCIKKKL